MRWDRAPLSDTHASAADAQRTETTHFLIPLTQSKATHLVYQAGWDDKGVVLLERRCLHAAVGGPVEGGARSSLDHKHLLAVMPAGVCISGGLVR